jgi:hypothetical protein
MMRERLMLAVEDLYEEWAAVGWHGRVLAHEEERTKALLERMQKLFIVASSVEEERMVAAFQRGVTRYAEARRLPRAHRNSA